MTQLLVERIIMVTKRFEKQYGPRNKRNESEKALEDVPIDEMQGSQFCRISSCHSRVSLWCYWSSVSRETMWWTYMLEPRARWFVELLFLSIIWSLMDDVEWQLHSHACPPQVSQLFANYKVYKPSFVPRNRMFFNMLRNDWIMWRHWRAPTSALRRNLCNAER